VGCIFPPLRGWQYSSRLTRGLRPFDKLRAGCRPHSFAASRLYRVPDFRVLLSALFPAFFDGLYAKEKRPAYFPLAGFSTQSTLLIFTYLQPYLPFFRSSFGGLEAFGGGLDLCELELGFDSCFGAGCEASVCGVLSVCALFDGVE
jgi:hypothetical protein